MLLHNELRLQQLRTLTLQCYLPYSLTFTSSNPNNCYLLIGIRVRHLQLDLLQLRSKGWILQARIFDFRTSPTPL